MPAAQTVGSVAPLPEPGARPPGGSCGQSTGSGSGGVSGNTAVPASDNNPPGLTDWDTQLFAVDPADLLTDYRQSQDILDFWRIQHG